MVLTYYVALYRVEGTIDINLCSLEVCRIFIHVYLLVFPNCIHVYLFIFFQGMYNLMISPYTHTNFGANLITHQSLSIAGFLKKTRDKKTHPPQRKWTNSMVGIWPREPVLEGQHSPVFTCKPIYVCSCITSFCLLLLILCKTHYIFIGGPQLLNWERRESKNDLYW